jgi:hypothetical protein
MRNDYVGVHLTQPLFRYSAGDRIVGHAYAPRERRLMIGVVRQVRQEMSLPPGYKRYLVLWDSDGIQTWHDERELSPLKTEAVTA